MSEMERLVLEKHQLLQQRQTLMNILGVVALEHGTTDKKGQTKLRVSKAQINKIANKSIQVSPAGQSGLAVTVSDDEPA